MNRNLNHSYCLKKQYDYNSIKMEYESAIKNILDRKKNKSPIKNTKTFPNQNSKYNFFEILFDYLPYQNITFLLEEFEKETKGGRLVKEILNFKEEISAEYKNKLLDMLLLFIFGQKYSGRNSGNHSNEITRAEKKEASESIQHSLSERKINSKNNIFITERCNRCEKNRGPKIFNYSNLFNCQVLSFSFNEKKSMFLETGDKKHANDNEIKKTRKKSKSIEKKDQLKNNNSCVTAEVILPASNKSCQEDKKNHNINCFTPSPVTNRTVNIIPHHNFFPNQVPPFMPGNFHYGVFPNAYYPTLNPNEYNSQNIIPQIYDQQLQMRIKNSNHLHNDHFKMLGNKTQRPESPSEENKEILYSPELKKFNKTYAKPYENGQFCKIRKTINSEFVKDPKYSEGIFIKVEAENKEIKTEKHQNSDFFEHSFREKKTDEENLSDKIIKIFSENFDEKSLNKITSCLNLDMEKVKKIRSYLIDMNFPQDKIEYILLYKKENEEKGLFLKIDPHTRKYSLIKKKI
jgi:hypothetical protein